MRKCLALLVLLIGIVPLLLSGCVDQSNKPIELTILHTNDTSGTIDPCG